MFLSMIKNFYLKSNLILIENIGINGEKIILYTTHTHGLAIFLHPYNNRHIANTVSLYFYSICFVR